MTRGTYRAALGLLAAAWALGPSPAFAAGTLLFEDDFESGTLLTSDVPPGRWETVTVSAPNRVQALGSSAHRGNFGLKVTDSDTGDGGTRASGQGYVTHAVSPAMVGPVYFRAWVQIQTATPGSGTNSLVSFREPGGHVPMVLSFSNPGAALVLSGDTADGNHADTVRSLVDTRWHLMELGLTGPGTTSGTRTLWMDGKPVIQQTGLALGPADGGVWSLDSMSVGEVFSLSLTFTGVLSFDDVRVGTGPLASTVAVGAPAPILVGDCGPLQLTLVTSVDGGTVPADQTVGLGVTTDAGALFSDPTCQSPATIAQMSPGAVTAQLYVRPSAEGPVPLLAQESTGDLLPGSGTATAVELLARIDSPAHVTLGQSVTLDGSGSAAAHGHAIARYQWTQVEGPAHVPLADTPVLHFAATTPGTYGFTLVVSDATSASPPARAEVTVDGSVPGPPDRLGGCYCQSFGGASALWPLALWCFRRRRHRGRSATRWERDPQRT